MDEYFPFIKKENIYLVPKKIDKSEYLENIKRSILVDDYGFNLQRWSERGGIAIKKSTSGRRKRHIHIVEHEEIFDILEKSNILKRIA